MPFVEGYFGQSEHPYFERFLDRVIKLFVGDSLVIVDGSFDEILRVILIDFSLLGVCID